MPGLERRGRKIFGERRELSRTIAGGTGCTDRTPRVFCAVSATITDVPCTPNCWKVLRSAWMPAPPPESDPAMVIAICIVVL